MKYWEVIADKLSRLGFSWGSATQTDQAGKKWFVVDAHCASGKRYIVWSDELLSAFLEIEKQTGAVCVDNSCAQKKRVS